MSVTAKYGCFGDLYANMVVASASDDSLNIVRGVVKDKNGVLFEVVGIDRGNGEVVPLFLVPIGGAKTIITEYEIVATTGEEVNPVVLDLPNTKEMH